jgi:hypothetical protein
MGYDNTPKIDVIRQNQTQNVREFLKAKGWINLLTSYEFMSYVELWVDYCMNGPTEKNKKRFKQFDSIMSDRMKEVEVDGIILE